MTATHNVSVQKPIITTNAALKGKGTQWYLKDLTTLITISHPAKEEGDSHTKCS